MALVKFKVGWADDNSVNRVFEFPNDIFFIQFQNSILTSFQFDNTHHGCFFTSNSNWHRLRPIASDIFENKSGAERLSAHKTKIGALIQTTDQRFLFEYTDAKKSWLFEIEMLGIRATVSLKDTEYPLLLSTEGLSPSQYGHEGLKANSAIVEVEEKYNLEEDMPADGFSI